MPILPSLHCWLMPVVLIVLSHDLTSNRGIHAWTYHYSTSPNRNWKAARLWCQEHFTDMVAIQNQGEITFLNQMLPFNPTYYWIGIRKVNAVWTWVGTNKTLTREAENWAAGEPNNKLDQQDCVEIYIKRQKDAAKWNDERCSNLKGALCYTASCSEQSCSVHAECLENIGNFTCHCDPGFQGTRCEEAVVCENLVAPERGFMDCDHPYGPHSFNSSCEFHCDSGFLLVGATKLICQADRLWDHPFPKCEVKKCPSLPAGISGGRLNCSHPLGLRSFNSTCEVRCTEGYELNGPDGIQCDHTGQWTGNLSMCTAVKCSSLLPPANGNVTCRDFLGQFSFGSLCAFTCAKGYSVTGEDTVTCLASGQWSSKPTPTCTAVRCRPIKTPLHASVDCQNPLGGLSYGSTCTQLCDVGFFQLGANFTKCTHNGNWSHSFSQCQAQRCSTLIPTEHSSFSCSNPHGLFRFGSKCISSCDQGFVLNGTIKTECIASGKWSKALPNCPARACPLLATAPQHGQMNCSHPFSLFSYGSHCDFGCNEGFLLTGAATIECNTSGLWDEEMPTCQVVQCEAMAPPASPLSMSCSHPLGNFSFGSQCLFTCGEGHSLNGTGLLACSSKGLWNQALPTCTARACPLLATAPQHGQMNCSHPFSLFSYGSHCDFGCNEGFLLTGAATIECNTSGLWDEEMPTCQVVQCEAMAPPASPLSMNCSHPLGNFSFGSQCLFTCGEGHSLNGTGLLACSSKGLWNQALPTCTARACPLLATAPQHGQMNCSHPFSLFSYGSHCDFGCNEGFLLTGAATIECNTSGLWDDEMPTCKVVQCEAMAPPASPLSMNCSHPLGNFSFGSQCLFTCGEGHSLNGTGLLACSSKGLWNQALLTCTENNPLLGITVPVYAAIAAASAATILLLVGLTLLIAKPFKKKGMVKFGSTVWEERENPAFEF